MTRSLRTPTTLLVALLVLSTPALAPMGNVVELDETAVFIEFNSTDGDFGIQFFWDGDAWDRMQVKGPNANKNGNKVKSKTVLNVKANKNLRDHGLTEGFFESHEPSADELDMEAFLARFPEGTYTFNGRTLEKDKLVGSAEFTHTLPAPPENLSPSDKEFVAAEGGLVASFDAVTEDLDGNPLEPELYEVVVETTDEEELLRVFSVILPGDVKDPEVTIPPEFLEGSTDYKLEVIVQEESGNRTISESEFSTL